MTTTLGIAVITSVVVTVLGGAFVTAGRLLMRAEDRREDQAEHAADPTPEAITGPRDQCGSTGDEWWQEIAAGSIVPAFLPAPPDPAAAGAISPTAPPPPVSSPLTTQTGGAA